MAHLANSNWFQTLEQDRQKKRACKQFTFALAQSIRLNIKAHDLVLAVPLGQPLHLSNVEVLEKWTKEQLLAEGMEADQAALELLSHKLRSQLSEVIA